MKYIILHIWINEHREVKVNNILEIKLLVFS